MKTHLTLGSFLVLVVACKDNKPAPPAAPPAVSATAVVLLPNAAAGAAPALAAASASAGDGGRGGHRRGHEDRFDPAEDSGVPITVQVKIGGAMKTWSKAQLDTVPKFTIGSVGNEGESRDTWSLRELAHTLVGPKARVVAVVGPEETKTLDKAGWEDAKRIPILHTTRRGALKFRWADPTGKWGDTEVRDVSRIEIEP